MPSLRSFKTGAILLDGLFVYDILWVFFTLIMVGVAKPFDAPIKLWFPTANAAAQPALWYIVPSMIDSWLFIAYGMVMKGVAATVGILGFGPGSKLAWSHISAPFFLSCFCYCYLMLLFL
ncbi:hypothetical protein V8G54_030508 [Vigna mungo]|uniref:Uncharacterized protein n=1 Tax=Vigna mungo TaxID=3915 RepID=A0AAQ3MVQ5_VIGMU